MYNSVARCQEKLSHFTVRDLQSLLAQLGLPRTGKKQELMLRILAILDENKDRKEEIVRCIDCAFRNIEKKEKVIRRRESTPAKAQVTKLVPVKRHETMEQETEGHRFRCICGSSLPLDPIIQDLTCQIWQHAGCVIVADPVDGQFNIPTQFLCEICRIERADPFLVTMAYPLPPVKLVPSLVASDGLSPALYVEKNFVLSNVHMKLLRSANCELQAWSMLMNDNVQFRMHWPLDSAFHINGTKLVVLNRPSSQLLGTNSRDDGSLIKANCKEGLNKITLSWNDTRSFCFGLRITKRQKIAQVLLQVVNKIINNKGNEESFQDALARICRCIGGNATKGENADSDFEVVDDYVTINLRCPISGSRIKVAARFKQCAHMGCFDLYTFVRLNEQSRKWQCPICLNNYSLENVIVDPYITKITSMLSMLDEELTEVEVNLDGSWRLKAKDGLNGSEFPWHSPNDSISNPNLNTKTPKANKLDKYKCFRTTVGNEVPIADENVSGSHFNPTPTSNLSSWITPPCMVKYNIVGDGRYGDLRTPSSVSLNQESFCSPTSRLGENMSMQDRANQHDWISLSLAAGIVHPIHDSASDSVNTMHNLSAMSSLGMPASSGILLPSTANNWPNFLDIEMLRNYNIFSPPVTPELLHVTDPNFVL